MKLLGHKNLHYGLIGLTMLYVSGCTAYNYFANKQAIFSEPPETTKQKIVPVSDSASMNKTAVLVLTQ